MDMLDLTRDLGGPSSKQSVYRSCRARTLIDAAGLAPDVREGVWAYIDTILGDPDALAAPALSKYLVGQGIPLSADAIRRHRRRECACPDRKDTDD